MTAKKLILKITTMNNLNVNVRDVAFVLTKDNYV